MVQSMAGLQSLHIKFTNVQTDEIVHILPRFQCILMNEAYFAKCRHVIKLKVFTLIKLVNRSQRLYMCRLKKVCQQTIKINGLQTDETETTDCND